MNNIWFKKSTTITSIIIIIMISSCSKTGHYEQGKLYLSEKQYPAAITEFQKVEPGEKDYVLAQSKINYIQGLQSFNDSLFESAEIQLIKVVLNDEYYHEAQLMLDKIQQRRIAINKPGKDTLIVKQEITSERNGNEKPEGKIKATEQTDAEITLKFVSDQKNLINSFESLYQSARTANVDSKQNYLSNMQSVVSKINALNYNARDKDAFALELRKSAIAWMNKRIEFIGKLIKDNTISETNSSRSLKEEGDKMYVGVKNLMNKF